VTPARPGGRTAGGDRPFPGCEAGRGRLRHRRDHRGLLRHWELDTDLAAAAICAGVGDVMTEEEWSLHLPERAYDPPCV